MNIQDAWEKALRSTKIIRSRAHDLQTFSDTKLPYTLLSEAMVNRGDTVVRKGEVTVAKPAIVLPHDIPIFEGFDFEKDFELGQDIITNFFLVRGVTFPSMKYDNKTNRLDIFNGHIDKAIGHYSDALQRREDVHSGLIVAPEDCWQFSLLIFICTQVAKSANSDIRRLLDYFKKKGKSL